MMMTGVILCGGSGTRLWPLSRETMPKQFVKLVDDSSLFEKTVARNESQCDSFLVVTNRDHFFLANEQLDSQKIATERRAFILEPLGRNTAPAIALAAFASGEDEILLVLPSDHLIENLDSYLARCSEARELARDGWLITFGIKPEYPETGYGYIETDHSQKLDDAHAFRVASFREKPDLETANGFVESGKFFWNSGMFMFKAGSFLEELKKHSPEVYEKSLDCWKSSKKTGQNPVVYEPRKDEMAAIKSISIDYAVMEKSGKVACLESEIAWNDLGSFDSLQSVIPTDGCGNSISGNVIAEESRGNIVLGEERLIALSGTEDLIVVDSPDALLITKRGDSQSVKLIVDRLKAGTPKEADLTKYHNTVRRPWGSYTVLTEGQGFQVKKIVVHPGGRLSLQKHLHRAEHWVVASGVANVIAGERKLVLNPGQSVDIAIEEVHRLENTGSIDTVIIETQFGSYLGEDDIIRLDDIYGRVEGS